MIIQVPLSSQYCTDIHIVQAIVVSAISDNIVSLTADSPILQQFCLKSQVIANKNKFLKVETEID